MSNPTPQYNTSNIDTVFTHLNQQDIEEFYNSYQRWSRQQQIEILQIQLDNLRKQILTNTARVQEVQPTAIELATLARLQSNGVSDVVLLDRMLDQGESWLDRTMQRLDYLEQLDDFIREDYTQWCRHALEGAYDWIDTVLDSNPTSLPPSAGTEDKELTEATEALFLQKISNDKDEDELVMLETTLKRPSITITDQSDSDLSTEETPATGEAATTLKLTKSVPEEAHPVSSISATDHPAEEIADVHIAEEAPVELNHATDNTSTQTLVTHENISLVSSEDSETPIIEEPVQQEYTKPDEPLLMENTSTFAQEHPPKQASIQISTETEEPSSPASKTYRVNTSSKRPNFIRRFLGKFWRS